MGLDDYTTHLQQDMTDEIGANLSDPALADYVDWDAYALHVADRDGLHIGTHRNNGEQYVA